MSLTGKSPADTYKDLAYVDNSNSGVDSTLRSVKTGEGSITAVSLSDNATYGSNTLSHPDQFEKIVSTPARGNGGTFTQKWFIGDGNLAAIGSSNSIYIAASTDSTTGTPTIKWGGDASNEYTNLVMKAVALPKTIVVGS